MVGEEMLLRVTNKWRQVMAIVASGGVFLCAFTLFQGSSRRFSLQCDSNGLTASLQVVVESLMVDLQR